MPLNWIDVEPLSFNCMLLLERVQISWLPGWETLPRREFALALRANPAVEWFLRHKSPEVNGWLDGLLSQEVGLAEDPAALRRAERAVLECLNDLLVYAVDPSIYDRLSFTTWDDRELTGLADFTGKRVVDIGAGTGRLALAAARAGASVVYAVEPVGNLRDYLREKARREGFHNVYVLDGLITAIPFEPGLADLVISGHVFGDFPAAEEAELSRVCKPGGMVILHPGCSDVDDEPHQYLVERGYTWDRFMEPGSDPGSGWKRKYWKRII